MVTRERHTPAPSSAARRPLLRLGVTGGIATGKSTTLEILRSLGAKTLDTDEIAHAVTEKGGAVWKAIVETFGRDILKPNGDIDRAKLGEIVFENEEKRKLLNSLVHPAVRERWFGEINVLAAGGFSGTVAVAIPLLYEVAAEKNFDAVLTVACSERTQLQRLQQRGLSDAQARQRVAAQLPLEEKMTRADYVIWNDSPLPVLEQQTRRVLEIFSGEHF